MKNSQFFYTVIGNKTSEGSVNIGRMIGNSGTEKERWAAISELKVGGCVAVNKGVDFRVEEDGEDGEERKRGRK